MTGMGRALMGTGYGKGDKRAIEAAQQAISSPLLEDVSINGATGILLNITGGPDLTLAEMNEACSLIAEAADPEANIIFGSVIDAHAGDEVRITVIATGFNQHAQEHPTQGAGRGHGHGHARGRENQMALPMQASVGHGAGPDHDGAAAADRREPVGTDVEPDGARWLRGAGAAAPGRERRDHQPRRVLLEHAARFRRPRWAPCRTAPQPNGPEWTPSERRNVRWSARRRPTQRLPPVPGRRSAQMQSPRPADELGVEESEFDKPTYLRRGLYAPE